MPNSFASARTRVWVVAKVCPQSHAGGIPQRQFLARPPTRSRASRTTTDLPAAAIARAATSPATPPPTTATSTRLSLRARDGFASLSVEPAPSQLLAPTAPAAPTAAPPMRPRRVSCAVWLDPLLPLMRPRRGEARGRDAYPQSAELPNRATHSGLCGGAPIGGRGAPADLDPSGGL